MRTFRRSSFGFATPAAAAALFLLSGLAQPGLAQASAGSPLPDAPQPQQDAREAASLANLPRNILKDQEAIWTSPARLRDSNAAGPIVLVLATTLLATTDHQVMSSHLKDSTLNDRAQTASTGLVGGFMAAPVALFGLGRLRHDDHASEAGLLAGEAILDSVAVNQVVKAVAMRERPAADGARGKFFQTNVGFDSSFASNHSVIAWSSAAVLASEYPGFLKSVGIYGLATGASLSRVLARQHFPSDALAGSAIGWMIGRYVYHRHQRYEELAGY